MRSLALVLVTALAVLVAGSVALADSVNLALNKPTVASAAPYSHQQPDKAVNGDVLDWWSAGQYGSQSDPMWITVDLGQNYSLTKIVLTGATTSIWPGYTNSYHLYHGTDGVNWTHLASGLLVDTHDPTDVHDSLGGIIARHLKYEVVGGLPGKTHDAHLAEFEAYGAASAVPLPAPAALGLVGLGMVFAMARRRRHRS